MSVGEFHPKQLLSKGTRPSDISNTSSGLNPYPSSHHHAPTNSTSFRYCLCRALFNASPFAQSGIFLRCNLSSIVSAFFAPRIGGFVGECTTTVGATAWRTSPRAIVGGCGPGEGEEVMGLVMSVGEPVRITCNM